MTGTGDGGIIHGQALMAFAEATSDVRAAIGIDDFMRRKEAFEG